MLANWFCYVQRIWSNVAVSSTFQSSCLDIPEYFRFTLLQAHCHIELSSACELFFSVSEKEIAGFLLKAGPIDPNYSF